MAVVAWGGLPVLVPSSLCSEYLRASDIKSDEEIETGARWRARKAILQNVRGMRMLKEDLRECLAEMRHERLYWHLISPPTSMATVLHSVITEERPTLPRRRPLFKDTANIFLNRWEPRCEAVLGMRDVRRLRVNPYEEVRIPRQRRLSF